MSSLTENFNDTVVKAYDEGFPLLMPRWGYVVSAFVLFLIGFFGFFLNLMVILLMFKDRQLWTPLNIILFNLVCSDFSVSVLGNPLTLISALFHRWVFGHTMCVLYGFFMALLGITSITTLTVISFERYLMVTRPLSSRHLSSKGAAMSIIFIWMYSLVLTTPPLLGWGNYVNEAANISCSVNWHEQSLNTLSYILFLFAMGQVVPLAVITFSYVNIIRTMKENSRRLGRVSRAESRATAMVFIMILSFTIAWTPYSIFALMEQFATEGIASPGMGVIPALVAKSSICYDPLIYVGMNTQFRQAIKRIFGAHSKGGNSRMEKGFNNTLVLSACKFSTFNEVTVPKSSETNFSGTPRRSKSISGADEQPDVTTTDNHRTQKFSDLSIIQENKTISDAERSGETVYDEDSSSNTKVAVCGENLTKSHEDTPLLKGTECEQLVHSANSSENNNTTAEDTQINIYENQIIEGDSSDCACTKQGTIMKNSHNTHISMIRHSHSLDFGRKLHENKPRKFSIEPKLESSIQPKNSFIGSKIYTFFDSGSKKSRDNFKSYLCRTDIMDSQDEF